MFTRLTATSSDGVDTADRAARAELTDGRNEAGVRDVEAVLEAFAAERLLTLAAGTVEISHEVLLTAWPLLSGTWLAETHADRIVRTRLHNAAADWARDSRDPSYLYNGSLLDAATGTATRISADPARHPPLSRTECDFLAAARRHQRRATARRRGAAWGAVLAIAASIASVVARHEATNARQRNQAIYTETLAEAGNLGSSNPSLAAQLNLAAYRMQPTPELISRLISTENTPLSTSIPNSATISSVAFSPHGRTLATTSSVGMRGAGGVVRLWDVANPGHPHALSQPLTTGVNWVAFSPDGRTLATSSDTNTIRLWDVADPAHPHALGQPLTTRSIAVNSVTFSPDGRTLAVGGLGGGGGVVRLWDVASPAHPRALRELSATGSVAVNSVAFSPDGRTLAAGDGTGVGMVRLWDVASPAHPRALREPLPPVSANSVAFSPDGRTLAVGGFGGVVRLWDVASPAHPRALREPLTTGNAAVLSVAFSPDGRTLATGGDSGVVRLWDVASPAQPQALGPALTGSTVGTKSGSVAFSPDGRTLATGGFDSAVRLWNLPQTVLTASTNPVGSVAFSPDGRTLAAAAAAADLSDAATDVADAAAAAADKNSDPETDGGGVAGMSFSGFGGVIQLWEAAGTAPARALGQPWAIGRIGVNSVAFSPDDRTLAIGGVAGVSNVGVVRLWDVASPAHPHPLGRPFTTRSAPIVSVAFSPHGRLLATGGDNGVVRLWDVASPAHSHPLGRPWTTGSAAIVSVAFSPDGRTLATCGDSGVVRLWDVASPAHPHTLGHFMAGSPTSRGGVLSVAFSRDGRTLATGGDNGVVRLWDVASPEHPHALGPSLTVSTDPIYSVTFSPDGRTLATGGNNGVVRLWNLNVSYAIKRICTIATNELTPQQWHTYIPQEPYQPPCAQSEP